MPILALCGEETRAEGHDTEMRDFFFSLHINEKFPYDSTNISKPNWVDIKQVMKMKFLLPEFSLNKNPK